jgi:hypothetical protein
MLTDVKKYKVTRIEAFLKPNDIDSLHFMYMDLAAFDNVECIHPDKIHVLEKVNSMINHEAIKDYLKKYLKYAEIEVYEYRVYPDTKEFEKKKIDLSC